MHAPVYIDTYIILYEEQRSTFISISTLNRKTNLRVSQIMNFFLRVNKFRDT